MSTVRKINDPQCELLLLRSCIGVSRLYFALRTCPPFALGEALRLFDDALRVSLEHIVTSNGPGLGDWQWRVASLPLKLGGFGIYTALEASLYAFLASRYQSDRNLIL